MNIFYLIAITAICWGGWPLLARLSNTDGAAYAPVIIASAIVPTIYYLFVHASPSAPASITIPSLVYLIPAGLMMGIGTISFSLVIQSTELGLSSSIPMINSTMIVVAVIGSVLLFGDNISFQKIAGIATILAGIYLLRPAIV